MIIPIKRLNEYAVLPEYHTEGASAMDLHAAIGESIILAPLERALIPTGFSMAIPKGYEAQIRGRSGLSLKHGITPANGIGTIDADYRGEVGVITVNLGNEPFIIEPGMRIAQMVIARHEKAEWEEVTELDKTERGEGGYGSTGH